MTHPAATAHDAVFLYNFAIKFLLFNKDDPDKTMKCFAACKEKASKFVKQRSSGKPQDIGSWL